MKVTREYEMALYGYCNKLLLTFYILLIGNVACPSSKIDLSSTHHMILYQNHPKKHTFTSLD